MGLGTISTNPPSSAVRKMHVSGDLSVSALGTLTPLLIYSSGDGMLDSVISISLVPPKVCYVVPKLHNLEAPILYPFPSQVCELLCGSG